MDHLAACVRDVASFTDSGHTTCLVARDDAIGFQASDRSDYGFAFSATADGAWFLFTADFQSEFKRRAILARHDRRDINVFIRRASGRVGYLFITVYGPAAQLGFRSRW